MTSSDDRRRYLIIGSVMIEEVTPLLRHKLESSYQQQFGTFQDFLNSQPVKHTLFHLRHRNSWCCTDKRRCTNGKLPLYHSQWDLLYSENPGQAAHYCHCKYTAKVVQLDDLDITLGSLIFLNCCTVSPADENAIKKLRQFKNELLSHNTTGGIKQAEYDAHWVDITTFVLQLDPSKQDDLIRLQNRPLDDLLCTKYFTCLLDIHEILDEMGISIQQVHDMLQGHKLLLDKNTTLTEENNDLLKKIVSHFSVTNSLNPHHHRLLSPDNHLHRKSTFGKELFTIEKTLETSTYITYVLLLDDGRIVTSDSFENAITISNIHDLHIDIIRVQGHPYNLTSINSSTVAVSYFDSSCIDIYNINSRLLLKSIHVTAVVNDITTMNNKLVVGVESGFHIIDPDTGVVMETINTGDNHPYRVHAFNDKIYFTKNHDYNLYCYNINDRIIAKIKLPGTLWCMTSLRDCSLYVISMLSSLFIFKKLYCYNINNGSIMQGKLPGTPLCMTSLSDGSFYVISYLKGENMQYYFTLLHVSPDLKKYKTVLKPDLKSLIPFDPFVSIDYNQTVRKMIVSDGNKCYVFNEK